MLIKCHIYNIMAYHKGENMKLTDYLFGTMTVAEFSKKSGLKIDTINKYKMGIRIPKADAMKTIYRVTEGQVQPNDFYEL